MCEECPGDSSSPAGSAAAAACTCNAGYTGPDGGACSACTAGKHKGEEGAGVCSSCPSGTYSAATGATSAYVCQMCPSGHASPFGSTSAQDCHPVSSSSPHPSTTVLQSAETSSTHVLTSSSAPTPETTPQPADTSVETMMPTTTPQFARLIYVSMQVKLSIFESKDEFLSSGDVFRLGVAVAIGSYYGPGDVFFQRVCQGLDCAEFAHRRAGADVQVWFSVWVRGDPQELLRILRSDAFLSSLTAFLSERLGRSLDAEVSSPPSLEYSASASGSNASTTMVVVARTAPMTSSRQQTPVSDVLSLGASLAGSQTPAPSSEGRHALEHSSLMLILVAVGVALCFMAALAFCTFVRWRKQSLMQNQVSEDGQTRDQRAIAFMMSRHCRLGNASSAAGLNDRVARLIMMHAGLADPSAGPPQTLQSDRVNEPRNVGEPSSDERLDASRCDEPRPARSRIAASCNESACDILSGDGSLEGRVEAEMLGTAGRPGTSRRRTRAQNREMETLLMDAEGREAFLEMMKQDRRKRQEQGGEVSSSDEERDRRRVDQQIRVMSMMYGEIHGQVNSGSCTHAQKEEMEAVFLDHEGAQRRIEYMRQMMQEKRSGRHEQGSDVSSDDEGRVEAEMLGTAGRPGTSRRRTRAQNREMETLLMDAEDLDRRRQDPFELLKADRRARRAQGGEVSSSDEERDSRRNSRVEAQLLGSHAEGMPSLLQGRREGVQDAGRNIEDALFVEDPSWRLRRSALLSQGNSSKLVVSSSQQGFTYTDSVAMRGSTKLTVQSKSVDDPKVLKQLQEQKEILRAAGGVSKVSDGEVGAQELGALRQTSRDLIEYWHNLSATHNTSEAGGDGQESLDEKMRVGQEITDEELQAVHGSAARMIRFWRAVEAQRVAEDPGDSSSMRHRGLGMYVMDGITLTSDVGLDGGSPIKASLSEDQGTNVTASQSAGADSQTPRATRIPQHRPNFKVLKPLSNSTLTFLDAPASRSHAGAAGWQPSINLVGRSTNTNSSLAREAQQQMEALKAHLARDVARDVHESGNEGIENERTSQQHVSLGNDCDDASPAPKGSHAREASPTGARDSPRPRPAGATLQLQVESNSSKEEAWDEGGELNRGEVHVQMSNPAFLLGQETVLGGAGVPLERHRDVIDEDDLAGSSFSADLDLVL